MNEPIQYPVQNRLPPLPGQVRFGGKRRDMIFAGLLFLFSLLAANFCLWAGFGLGAAVAAIGLFLTGLIYIRPCCRRVTAYGIALICLYFLCALSMIFSDGAEWPVIAAMIILSALTVTELLALRRWPAGSLYAVGDWCHMAFACSFGRLSRTFFALLHKENPDGSLQKRKIGGIILGVVCAVPVTAAAAVLLMFSDAAFENLVEYITFDRLGEIFGTLVIGTFLFLLLFGQYFAAMHQERNPEKGKARNGYAEPSVLIAFLTVLCIVYVLYLFSQLAYFFSAFSGILPENFTVAEYARRGFFEMGLVSLINLAVIGISAFLVRKKKEKLPASIKAFSLFLCVFSLLLIGTALSKMVLYIHTYGMTRARIFTSVFMVFLAVVFLAAALRIFLQKLPYMKAAVIAGAVLAAALCFADADRVTAAYNVDAYLSGKLETIDMYELQGLRSDAVVPYVWKLREDPEVSDMAYLILNEKMEKLGLWDSENNRPAEKPKYDWRSFNLPEYAAFRQLREAAAEIHQKSSGG